MKARTSRTARRLSDLFFVPVKKQFRNARRRFGTTNKNILSAIDAQSNAERIPNRPALPLQHRVRDELAQQQHQHHQHHGADEARALFQRKVRAQQVA